MTRITLSSILTAMVLIMGLSGCKDEPALLQPKPPKVTLEALAANTTSLVVKVFPENSTSCSVVCLNVNDGKPDAENIMKNGKTV